MPKKNKDETRERPTSTGEPIDLSFDIHDRDAIKVPALTAHLEEIHSALEAFDHLTERADKVNEEIANRLAAAGLTEHVVHGEKYRVRKVNGSAPPTHRLYAASPKKPKEAAKVDINDL